MYSKHNIHGKLTDGVERLNRQKDFERQPERSSPVALTLRDPFIKSPDRLKRSFALALTDLTGIELQSFPTYY